MLLFPLDPEFSGLCRSHRAPPLVGVALYQLRRPLLPYRFSTYLDTGAYTGTSRHSELKNFRRIASQLAQSMAKARALLY